MKFKPESFSKYDPHTDRLSREVLHIITKNVGVESFGLNLFGVDILVQEETGCVYLIDINYFSSYDGLKKLNVKQSFRDLILRKHNENIELMNHSKNEDSEQIST
jgi:hypothetical protein